jgi:hypothetical protein
VTARKIEAAIPSQAELDTIRLVAMHLKRPAE